MTASYVRLAESGDLAKRAEAAWDLADPCRLCPHGCGARRLSRETGSCGIADAALIASAGPHFGEERPLVGRCGSGTIFFTGCNLSCVFCQNYHISQLGEGAPVSAGQLADTMLRLQALGCHNVNLVTPTHVVPMWLSALVIAAEGGLTVPIVYNCGGYESPQTLRILDGVVDIYMPDVKYSSEEVAGEYSGAVDYWERVSDAVAEMHRQVGDLSLTADGTAERGLLVRHLVLPEGAAGTGAVMELLASLSRDTYVNVMDQYRPEHLARSRPSLSRPITGEEYADAVAAAERAGLSRGFGRLGRG